MGITLDNRPTLDPKQVIRDCLDRGYPIEQFRGRAAFMECPAGRGPGRGAVLMRYDDYKALDPTKDYDLTFDDGTRPKAKYKTVRIANVTNILPGADQDPAGILLLELVDRRFRLFRKPINRAYNVKSPANGSYVAATLNSGTAYTWTQLVSDLWSTVGTADLGSYPGLPFTPHGTPEGFFFFGATSWDALNDVVERIGCVVVYDPFADTFTIAQAGVKPATWDATYAAFWPTEAVWDSYFYAEPRYVWPEKLRVHFRTVPATAEGSTPWTTVDVAVTAPVASTQISGTYEIIYDDLYATGSNGATLASRAAERATDWTRVRRYYWPNRVQQVNAVRKEAAALMPYTVGRFVLRDVGTGIQTEIGGGEALKFDILRMLDTTGTDTSSDNSFWAEITGNAGGAEPATTYSWKQKILSPSTHLFVDASPAVTGTNTLKRVPAVGGTPSIMPNGKIVRVWPSPTDTGNFECKGGVEDVTCVGGELQVVQ